MTARTVLVAIAGTALTVVGLAMLVLPGPGIAVLLLALAVFSAEFAWARRHRATLMGHLSRLKGKPEPTVCWWCGERDRGIHECPEG